MATQAVDVACTLLNVIMSQVMAFRELDKDAKELHRHLSSMRHLIESLSLSPGRTLTSPEANSALVVSSEILTGNALAAMRLLVDTCCWLSLAAASAGLRQLPLRLPGPSDEDAEHDKMHSVP